MRIDGPDLRPERPGVEHALRLLEEGRRGPARESDRETSTFPMTKAARAAIELSRASRGVMPP